MGLLKKLIAANPQLWLNLLKDLIKLKPDSITPEQMDEATAEALQSLTESNSNIDDYLNRNKE